MCMRYSFQRLATRYHCLAECPANQQIDNTHIQKIERITKEWNLCWDNDQCLFAREFVPKEGDVKQEQATYLNAQTCESQSVV